MVVDVRERRSDILDRLVTAFSCKRSGKTKPPLAPPLLRTDMFFSCPLIKLMSEEFVNLPMNLLFRAARWAAVKNHNKAP